MNRVVILVLVIAASCSASLVEVDDVAKRELRDFQTLLRRVIGGTVVEHGVWPWLVALKGKLPTRSLFGFEYAHDNLFCGASLIHRKWILTAAHCFPTSRKYKGKGLQPRYWTARFGDVDRESSLWDDFKGWIGDVFDKDVWKDWVIVPDKIILYPRYDSRRNWLNDIALVRLSEEVPAEPHHVEDIQKVALAPPGDSRFPADNQTCIFKGWGCRKGGGKVADVAFQVELPKWNDEACARLFGIQGTTRLCAGQRLSGMGICSGDSGGPLVCKKGTLWYQVGIASFTAANAPGNYPGVFTRVSAYANWVKKTIREN